MATRVHTKGLFNFQQKGVYDEDVAALNVARKKMVKEMTGKEMITVTEDVTPEANALVARHYMAGVFTKMAEHPTYAKVLAACDHDEFNVPVRDGNDAPVKVLVHTPKTLRDKKDNIAVIYAHGGGVISGTAEMYKPMMAALAFETNVVVFNVDYRLAPEVKCPGNILDFYCAVKYIIEKFQTFNIDPKRIVISGESGGGYICFGTMVMMAQKNEAHLIKAAFPIIPMISDYFFSDPIAMTAEERDIEAQGMRVIWKSVAKDLTADWSNPLLFPAKASDKLIQKMPPTVIFSAEFDMFITETERMARRMRSNGRLLEFCCLPGIGHASYLYPGLECYAKFYSCYKLAVDEYVKCN